ncbi:MAG: hypothetical protein L6243_02335 [Candidatus Altiarchaeales archaeon]|nr:hypothetical protein [Candidatus Altiarchaeota archaeon]MCG2782408.1 hypothetical protein [Candidatus Altiarchaeales archaeon]
MKVKIDENKAKDEKRGITPQKSVLGYVTLGQCSIIIENNWKQSFRDCISLGRGEFKLRFSDILNHLRNVDTAHPKEVSPKHKSHAIVTMAIVRNALENSTD